VKEEFLSEDLKAKINLQQMKSLQLSTPVVKKESFSIFTSSHKKRTRENSSGERNTQKDKVAKKRPDVSSSSASAVPNLKNFEHQTKKFSFSKDNDAKATENDPIVIETLNTTIELIDSDDDEYDYKVIKQSKRASILDNTKPTESQDIEDRGNNDDELVFDISQDEDFLSKLKPKKTNLQQLLDS